MTKPIMGIPNNIGSVILSFDFEIGWGDITNPRWRGREARGVYKRLREKLPVLLDEMDRLEIPATWATVGAMFDEPKERDFSHLPTNIQAQIATCLSEAEPESFNGRDLFEMVLARRCPHHIASHTYSHVPFTLEGMNGDIVQQDLSAFQLALGKYGLSTDRFVYPENREMFPEFVTASGIKIARVSARKFSNIRMINLIATATLSPPLVSENQENCGLIRHSGSMLFHDSGKSWRHKIMKRRIDLGLKAAIKNNQCLHIWSHPFNHAESEELFTSFLETLRKIARARDAGKIEVVLM